LSTSGGSGWSPVQTFGPYDLSVPRAAGQRGSNRTLWGTGLYVVVRINGQRLVLTSAELQQYINAQADIVPAGPGR
jgi:hypothetical protein